jgi:AraC-like DNA-binding protein
METLCEDLASRLQVEANVVEDVIAVLRGAGTDIPTQEQVAATLCISPRSMRRQLKEQGQSFRSLVDEVRMRRALEGLRDPEKSIRKIAEACGFSELRGFYSAFHRWTGPSPAAWREAQLNPADHDDD